MSRARDVADGALGTIAGTNGQVLTSNGTVWSSQAVPTELPAYGSDGNILTSTGSAWASEANPLPAHGTSGNVLTSTGSAWASQAPAGGGAGWTWLARNNITSSTSYSTFDSSVVTSTYDNYAIVANGINFGAVSENIGFFVHANGAWQQGTGKNDYDHSGIKFNTATDTQNTILSGGGFNRTNVYMDTTGYGAGSQNTQYSTAFTLYMSTKAQNSKARNIWWHGSFNNSTNGTASYGGSVTVGAASYDGELTNNITGIRFYGYSGNNFANGTWDLYGLARS